MPLWASVLAALSTSLAGCWLITASTLLRNLGNVAPVENRWHQQPTPGLGGIPIYLSLATMVTASGNASTLGLTILGCSLLLLMLGSYDDIKHAGPRLKLVVQIGVAMLFLSIVSLPGDVFSLVHWVISLVWIVAIINAINLLDNMDGLSGGIALIACVTIATLIGHDTKLSDLSTLYLILAAALAGFLVLNKNPAKLFMGDAGALWIGFAVGVGALLIPCVDTAPKAASPQQDYAFFWLIPLLVCAVPISDTLMVIITRKLRGQPVSIGGQDHLSHRLVCLGFSERFSVALLWVTAILASLLALLTHSQAPAIWAAPVCVYVIALLVGVVFLTRVTSAPNGVARKNTSANSL